MLPSVWYQVHLNLWNFYEIWKLVKRNQYRIWQDHYTGVRGWGATNANLSRKWANIFGRILRLLPFFMFANSDGSGEDAWMRRLAWAFAGRLCDKYHNLMSWLSYSNESHGRPAKAQASLRIRAALPQPSLFAHIKKGSRRRIRPEIRHLAPLDGCTCAFEKKFTEDEKCPRESAIFSRDDIRDLLKNSCTDLVKNSRKLPENPKLTNYL